MAPGVAPAEGSEIGSTEAVITASYFSKTWSSGLNARCDNERRPTRRQFETEGRQAAQLGGPRDRILRLRLRRGVAHLVGRRNGLAARLPELEQRRAMD